MVGVTVITHGDLAKGLSHSIKMIMGETEQFNHLGLYEGEDLDNFSDKVMDSIKEVNSGEGVLVFVDLFGATPFNTVVRKTKELQDQGIDFRIITGVNLPVVMETLNLRQSMSLDALKDEAASIGKMTIESYQF